MHVFKYVVIPSIINNIILNIPYIGYLSNAVYSLYVPVIYFIEIIETG